MSLLNNAEISGDLTVSGTISGQITVSPKVKIESNKNVTPSNVEQVVVPSENYDALAQVTVGAVSLQNKTVTPSASQQTVTADSGYNGLGTVTVNAAPAGEEVLDKLMYESSNTAYDYNIAAKSGDNKLRGFYNGKLNITTPDNITIVYSRAFEGCKFIKNFLGTRVSSVQDYAFNGCSNLETVTLPRDVPDGKFYSGAFQDCAKLNNVYLGGFFQIYSSNYNQFTHSCTIHVPANLLSQYQNDSEWTAFIAAQAALGVTITLAGDYVPA